ncbi:MAG: glycoside hydrolase family 3 N-terminal domain-containing protein, partial [Pseudomonadota bacterium]
LAPVLDVNMSAGNEVIGVRSFGDNPEMVAELGASYIAGLQSRRVSATAKHFPGHGGTIGNSHYQAIKVNSDLDTLRNADLKPFVYAIRGGVDAVMTAHVSMPKIDTSGLPATLSHRIITGLLREELGFNGVVITDDMEMGAIAKDISIGQAAVEAVLAGCDVITVVWTDKVKEDVYKALLSAVKKGVIKESRIDESVRRIIAVKLKRKLLDDTPDADIEEVRRVVGNKLHQQISHLIAQKSITMVRNLNNVIPVNKDGEFAVISPFAYLSLELESYGIKNTQITVGVKMNKAQTNKIIKRILKNDREVDAYIVAVVDDSQARLANILKHKTQKPVIVASLDSPYVYSSVRDADAYICAYSFRSQAIKALAKVITGESEAVGQLPVEIEN